MVIATLLLASSWLSQAADEADFYRLETLETPPGIALEVGGMALLPDGRPLICTRRGEVFVVNGAFTDKPTYHLFAEGLQEPLGLLVHGGWIWSATRGELLRMRDVDGDDRVDEIETIAEGWEISGNYHEYNFGPRLGPDGRLWVTTNKPFGDEPFGRADWRGFALAFEEDGTMVPIACGLRSPAGIEASPWGDVFYTDNQGEWCGASKLAQLEPGDFHGHPWGIFSCKLPRWGFPYPGDPLDGVPMPEVGQRLASFKLPAVWFPYDKMGRSPAGFVWDTTGGDFGPFQGQVFVGDQYAASVMRVSLERVNGRFQGACYPFRDGLLSGITRLAWDGRGGLYVGMTNRGWGSRGVGTQGLQRLTWTGKTPFEILTMSAVPGGFRLSFTQDLAPGAEDTLEATLESYTYNHHASYGSPEIDRAEPGITAVTRHGARELELTVAGLRAGYVHELHLSGLRSSGGDALLHSAAYYTLIELP